MLKVVIEGHPEPIVKWYREEIEITNSRDYILTQTDKTYTLTIVEVFPEDSGTFRVVATNADGSVTSETNVFVEGKTILYYFSFLLLKFWICKIKFLSQVV